MGGRVSLACPPFVSHSNPLAHNKKYMRYFLGANGQEYATPEDAQKYGEGLVGYRDLIKTETKITYQELTGMPPPESPVDHVIEKKPLPENIIIQPAPEPPKEEIPVATGTTTTTSTDAEVKIVATEPEKPVETPKETQPDWDTLTEPQLKEMAKARHFRGVHFMKRDKLVDRLKKFYI